MAAALLARQFETKPKTMTTNNENDTAAAERDWKDDFPHDNGMYENTCYTCRNRFMGNKHRRICKACDKAAAYMNEIGRQDCYESGPEGMPRVKRMTDAVLDCIIRGSLFSIFDTYVGEDRDRLHGLMHDTAEEVLARVPAWPAAAAPVSGLVSKAEIHTLRRLIECAEKLDERPRPMCRDCADEDGTCPNSGLECDMGKLFANAKTLHNKLAAHAASSVAAPVESELPPLAETLKRVASRLQSFADRLCNDTALGEKYEGDEAELRTAIGYLRQCARAPQPDQARFTAESIDTPEFARLLLAWHDARLYKSKGTDVSTQVNAIIAHIDAKLAEARRAASEQPVGYITQKALDELRARVNDNPLSLWPVKNARPGATIPLFAASPSPDPAQAGTSYAGMNVIVDPTLPPNTMRSESGDQSVTITNVDFGAQAGEEGGKA